MKQFYTWSRVIFVVFVFTTFSCEKGIDDELNSIVIEDSAHSGSRFSIRKLERSELQENSVLNPNLQILKGLAEVSASKGSNPIKDLRISVETDQAVYVEDLDLGLHSYSFLVKKNYRLGVNLTNLVFQSRSSGGYDTYLVEYGFGPRDYKDLSNKSEDSQSVKWSKVKVDISGLNILSTKEMHWECYSSWTWVEGTEHDGDLHGVNSDGACTVAGCSYNGAWVYEVNGCSYVDTGGGGGNPVGEWSASGGGGNSIIVTAPNVELYE